MATVKKKSERTALLGAMALAREMGRFPSSRIWADYDEEADVLYLSFQRPQKATDTVDLDDKGVLMRYRGKELVGITILNASTR